MCHKKNINKLEELYIKHYGTGACVTHELTKEERIKKIEELTEKIHSFLELKENKDHEQRRRDIS